MTKFATDRREIEARPDPEGERRAGATAAEYLDVRLRMARVLLRLDRGRTFHLSGCSSIVHYAVLLGIPSAEGRMLIDLARALESEVATPAAGEDAPSESVEDRIRAGRLTPENASLYGKLIAKPGLIGPGEDWLGAAESMPAAAFRRRVNERLEQAAQGEPAVVPITVHVAPRARDAFARARVLASREAQAHLTEGQTFTLIVDRYLDAADESRRGAGTRRAGPTSESQGDRYVPAAVRRAVLERSGDRCEVAGCTYRIFLELAHVVSHAGGGSREADNLLRLCHTHHTQFDAGCIRVASWRDGRPIFTTARGEPIAPRRVGDVEHGAGGAPARDEGSQSPQGAARVDDVGVTTSARRGSPSANADHGTGQSEAIGGSWASDGAHDTGRVSESPPPAWVSCVRRARARNSYAGASTCRGRVRSDRPGVRGTACRSQIAGFT